ncbi:DUF4192 domain-containing protein [Kitasatospora sp. NA04385]|uniref:DUF4192 domain-containing protein n=1 Tax=Kitasatospora sp. NA04385 TaxID=2742135 RepID=UPI0015926E8B|nr:DUF4192 domain-containing protein [Kitasatospora sp. NA04385]QKW22328.1 DUF4192 domain-containing protein [Kitasatospora sp. NA04385]
MTPQNDQNNVVNGPESLVHILPHLFGYHPEASLVLSGLTPEGRPVHIIRIALPADTSDWQGAVQNLFKYQQSKASERPGTVAGLVAWICPDPADPLYGEHSMTRHRHLAGLLGVTAHHCGADLQEVVYVTRDRYWLMSTDAFGEGRPISSPPAEFDATALPRSGDVRAALAPVTGDRAYAIAKAVDKVLKDADVQIRTTGHMAVAKDAAALIERTIRDLVNGTTTIEQIPDDTAAWLLVGLQYSDVAGVALEHCEDSELPAARDLWLHLARLCPDDVNWCVVEPTVLYAATSWGLGQEGIARLALHAASDVTGEYHLIRLLVYAMNVEHSYEGFRKRLRDSRASRSDAITG